MSQLALQPAPSGGITILKSVPPLHVQAARSGALVCDPLNGHFYKHREKLLPHNMRQSTWQRDFLAWLRDNVHKDIPRAFYQAVLGHDLHVSTLATLAAKHFHADQRDPFTGEMGWLENIGMVSQGKVTTAFVTLEALMLQTDTTVIGDFKYHEVGTDGTAESNSQTALIVTTGIARVTGTQVASALTYTSVATVTADSSETWQEHGLFSQSSGADAAHPLMDRSLISPTVAVVNLDTVQFTYVLTKVAES